MARRAVVYTIDFRWEKLKQVTPVEFAEFKARALLFESQGKKKLRLKDGYTAKIEDGELRIREVGRRAYWEVSIPSSWRAVERARVFGTTGIREAGERQLAIQEMCRPKGKKNEFTSPDLESFGTLKERV